MKYKAQSAIEFLTTYSWAILVFLILIGSLIYFGVFDFNQFISSSCDFGPQLECIDFQTGADGSFLIKFRNNFAERIELNDVTVLNYNIEAFEPIEISTGLTKDWNFNITETLLPGEKTRFKVSINFSKVEQDAPNHTIGGTIVTRVCDGELIVAGYISGCES